MIRTVVGSAMPLVLLTAGLGGFMLLAKPVPAQQAVDLERGAAVYEYWCLPCHAAGPGHPGTQSLQFRYAGSRPAVLTDRDDLTPAAIRVFVRQGVLSMPPFRKTEISDAELDHLAAWLAGSR